MTRRDELHTIRRDLRWLKVYALVTTTVIAGLGVAALRRAAQTTTFDRIVAQRIDIVEPNGTRRAVLTNDALTPGPIIDGNEGRRNQPMSGLILYDSEGDEIGGYASGAGPNGSILANVMDFGNGEALASFRRVGADGKGMAALFLNDQPPPDMPAQEAMRLDWSRIRLQSPDRNAEIVINDTQRRPRIRMLVDAQDQARLEILDEQGQVVFQAPDA